MAPEPQFKVSPISSAVRNITEYYHPFSEHHITSENIGCNVASNGIAITVSTMGNKFTDKYYCSTSKGGTNQYSPAIIPAWDIQLCQITIPNELDVKHFEREKKVIHPHYTIEWRRGTSL